MAEKSLPMPFPAKNGGDPKGAGDLRGFVSRFASERLGRRAWWVVTTCGAFEKMLGLTEGSQAQSIKFSLVLLREEAMNGCKLVGHRVTVAPFITPSFADSPVCGAVPALPTTAETAETLKGELKGQADLLTQFVGKAELGGQIEAAKKSLYQNSDQFFAA